MIKIIAFGLVGILTLVSIYIIVIVLILRNKDIDIYPDPTDDYDDTEIKEWLNRKKED